MGWPGKALVLAMAGVQLAVLIYALATVQGQIDLFNESVPDNMRVVVTQEPGFWMPLHALIPTNCSSAWTKKQYPSPRDNISTNDKDTFQVEGCHGNITFRKPTGHQNYFAMIFLQTGGETSVAEIKTCRFRMFVYLGFMTIFNILMAVGPKFSRETDMNYHALKLQSPDEAEKFPHPGEDDVKTDSWGEWIIQKMLKSIKDMISGLPAKWTVLITQLTILSLFAVFAHGSSSGPYLLMSYVPGRAYALMGFLLAIQVGIMFAILAEWTQGLAGFGGLFACCSCLLCPIVTFPMIGYGMYNLQFLYNLEVADWMEGSEFFSADWPSTMQTVGHASQVTAGVNVVDVLSDSVVALIA